MYALNLHPGVSELIIETENMRRLQLKVPDLAQLVVSYSTNLAKTKERMMNLLKRDLEIRYTCIFILYFQKSCVHL